MDFGIARMAGSEATLTQRGMGLGTPAFMAPEQAGDGPEKITKVSDVYALGAILYTAVTGRPPFHEENALRTLVKVVSDEPPPAVRQLNPDIPEELEHICMKCLEKKPENRYPSAWSLAKDVRRLHKELKRNGGAPSTVPSNLRLKLTTTGKLVSITRSTTTFGRSRECDVHSPGRHPTRSPKPRNSEKVPPAVRHPQRSDEASRSRPQRRPWSRRHRRRKPHDKAAPGHHQSYARGVSSDPPGRLRSGDSDCSRHEGTAPRQLC